MIGFAVVFGLLAVFIAQVWLNNQASMQAKNFDSKPAVAMQTIVVAKQQLRFGTELSAASLKEIPWPEASMPAGAFHKISDVLHGGRRVVLTAIEADEPVLSLKITGPGQRATLSALARHHCYLVRGTLTKPLLPRAARTGSGVASPDAVRGFNSPA